jgi:hypothetical protein
MSEIKTSVIFDLDDGTPTWEENGLNWMIDFKTRFPKFNVTIFTILGRWNKKVLKLLKGFDFIQLGAHGYTHLNNDEVLNWDKKRWYDVINEYEYTDQFVKVFKAPNWQMSALGYYVLKDMGWAVAVRKHQIQDLPAGMKYYCFETNLFAVHGHTWTLPAHSREHMFLNWTEKTNFDFVSNNLEEKI